MSAVRSVALLAGVLPVICGADFTTYIGDQFSYSVAAIATDAAGNTYVTGSRGVGDVFVTKLDPSGNIVFTTTFGGKASDAGNAIAVDPAGNIWVGGSTSSDNFPLRDALPVLPPIPPPGAGFLVRLAPDGIVVYSSYFYGPVNGLATDASGNVYLTGTTVFVGFPTTPGLPAGPVMNEGIYTVSAAFVTKLDPTGSKILYSAAIGGFQVDCPSGGSSCFESDRITSGVAIALDQAGDALITGNTNTLDLPVTSGGFAGFGAFAAKINAAGNQLAYLTYLSPADLQSVEGQPTYSTAIATDASGNAYITGFTSDPAFPATAGAFQTKLNSGASSTALIQNVFAVKLNPQGATEWATFLGGPGPDGANAITVNSSGNVWLTGGNSAGFPSASGSRLGATAAGDFVVELSADGSKLLYSTELATAGQALVFDPTGLLHVASETGLVSTLTLGQQATPRIIGIVNAAQGQVAGRIAPGEIISIFGFGLGSATPAIAAPQNGRFPTSLSGVQVLVNGTPIPLLYVSESQVNAEVPSPLNGDDEYSATIQVINGSSMLPQFRTSVDDAIFGIFTNPDGSVKAINQDGTVNSQSNPAPGGSIVSMWATGFGTAGPPVNGSVTTAVNNWCSYCQLQINFYGPETVQYAGSSPGLVDGLMQINFVARAEPNTSGAVQSYFTFSLSGQYPEWFIWVSAN